MSIPHDKFVMGVNNGDIFADIDINQVITICEKHRIMETSIKFAILFFKFFALLLLIGGGISFFFIKWYWSLVLILLPIFIVIPALRKTASQFVLEKCLSSKEFYEEMIYINCLKPRSKNQ